MRHKKLIIIPTALACMYLALLALQSTIVGYALVVWFGVEYFTQAVGERQQLEKEGDAPNLFNLHIGQNYKDRELIPCLLYYKSARPNNMFVLLEISKDEADAKFQYLDLTRLELILEDDRKENLLECPDPLRVYFGDHKDAHRFCNYNAGRLENLLEGCKTHHTRVYFYSSLWPPRRQVTLIAEGTFRRNTGEDLPFRQVSVWKFSRDWEFRKIRPE